MGIPYYFHKLTNEHKNIISNECPKCDRLFLDFNGIIHNTYNRVKNDVHETMDTKQFESLLIKNVIKYMIFICKHVSPKKLLYICIDGVAPLGKIKQQRTRRYLSNWLKVHTNQTGYQWDSNKISPGTEFMSKLSRELRDYIKYNQEHVKYEIILSDSLMSGEGEHKIFDYIHFHENKNNYDIIYGLDADLIMLSLICNKSNKFLLREPQHFNSKSCNDQFLCLNIQLLKDKLLSHYEKKIDIHSYVFLCFLIGNDFLPNLTFLNIKNNGIDTIMTTYMNIMNGRQIVNLNGNDRFDVNYNVLCELFEELCKYEDNNLKMVHDQYYKRKMNFNNERCNKYENYGIYNKNKSMQNVLNYANWRQHYYNILFDNMNSKNTIITSCCKNYVEGLNWCMEYYFNKTIISNWQYNFNYSPTILDLYNICNVHKFEFKQTKVYDIKTDLQLLMILPITSIDVLPNNLQSIMREFRYGYYYPTDFRLETYLKSKLHECIPILPKINYHNLELAYLNTIS